MKINGIPTRTLSVRDDSWSVEIIDQTRLPHALETVVLKSADDAAYAIKAMLVRGAPLIGVTAAYGVALAMRKTASDAALADAIEVLASQRPTAVNLRWALEEMRAALTPLAEEKRVEEAYARAAALAEEDVEMCRRIGLHGAALLKELSARKNGAPVNVLTHCNAGWLACIDWGTATSPIYHAHDAGIPVHVFVDETRPRNQGASLTAYELGQHGVPHTLVADNAGGHLMQQGEVDIVITGADRVTANGDAANKIGTYLKALAAFDTGVPFFVALPSSTIDWTLDGGSKIPIEERDAEEVLKISGRAESGRVVSVAIAPAGTRARNPAFDVTPARLLTGLITERGVCAATADGLLSLYPEREELSV